MSPRGRVSDALGSGDAEATEAPARPTGATGARLRPRRRTSGKVAAIDPAPVEEPVAAFVLSPIDEPVAADELPVPRAAAAAGPVAAADPVASADPVEPVDARDESFDDESFDD